MMRKDLRRCFIAINLPKNVADEIKKIQELLIKSNLISLKLTEIENLHLTLKFLGEIDEDKVERVKIKLREIDLLRFDCELGEIGVFSENFLRIIWIKVDGKIFDLQKEIDKNLEEIFEKENRFMSHITISRVKNVKDKTKFINFLKKINLDGISFGVDEFSLMESKLSSKGSVYKELEKYKLESKYRFK